MVKVFFPVCFISISFGVNSKALELTPKLMEIEGIRIKRFNLEKEKT